jgi:hypothetical protein
MTTDEPRIQTFTKGKRIGVNVDDQPVGYAVRVNRAGEPEQWTAFVYIREVPFDTVRTGFKSADAVVLFIAKNGRTPDHLKRER